jgi:hypothetical protein
MRERQTCVGCNAQAPATETNYTLISSQHGWRLTRKRGPDGVLVEWRCPTCWAAYKQRGGGDAQARPSTNTRAAAKADDVPTVVERKAGRRV